jgi:hypothetical protein
MATNAGRRAYNRAALCRRTRRPHVEVPPQSIAIGGAIRLTPRPPATLSTNIIALAFRQREGSFFGNA